MSEYNLKINSQIASSELSADNFGVRVSLRAFKESLQNQNQKSPPLVHELVHLDYDYEKLFFIRYAQSFCKKTEIINRAEFENLHPLSEFRAFHVSILPEFKRSFKCTKTKPEFKTCSIFNV
jgi:hypothetical protein